MAARQSSQHHSSRYLDPDIYHVVWVAPLEIEARAALAILDERHRGQFKATHGTDYIYKAGRVGDHNVVIATFPAGHVYGTNSAAALASQIKTVFPNIRFALLVGVAAGLPSAARDIRLGDVLVAMSQNDCPAVVDYELGRELEGGFQPLRQGHVLAAVPSLLGSAMGSLRLERAEAMAFMLDCYEQAFRTTSEFVDPGLDSDVLLRRGADGAKQVAERHQRNKFERTRVWYGTIGSGNRLLRNATIRDQLRDRYNLIGLEMEAAGIMNHLPTGVIRGASDYRITNIWRYLVQQKQIGADARTSLWSNLGYINEVQEGNERGSQDQQALSDKSKSLSIVHSPSDKTRILGFGDITALLEYAKFTIFEHFNNRELLQHHSAEMTRGLRAHWELIVLLRDDLKRGVSLTQYCLANHYEDLFEAALE
ncbi:nucleoside phosphorylase domain-containing protein [Microdochium bolleyi]|uniref:Nucleoside phosphorylase domain-containing protein n=1 Tax=Microdochium bolleyi TaxID=196109 RepID=A0A136IRQ5_9PEZI|nr:nucleoside phosphorylase domain-containing protein [Microdochium bolleyi]